MLLKSASAKKFHFSKMKSITISFTGIMLILLSGISGCSNVSGEKTERIMETCRKLYENTTEESLSDDLEVIRGIVSGLGEEGYTAIDGQNQIDMTEPEQVIRFCEKADRKEEAELVIVEVTDRYSLALYNLKTRDGNVNVEKSCYRYEKGEMQQVFTGGFAADFWQYTEEGYLMFSGTYFSEEKYVLTLSDGEEHAAFRVQPLDEKCRELNRKYLLSAGYEKNNLFLTDWKETDFGNLDFYDLYDLFYEKVNGKKMPYIMDDNLSAGAVYEIPGDEFERVIMTYFNIDSETLQTKTIYDSENGAYEYRPRGFYETEYPEYPYPEVVEYEENSDGTIKLTVHVVFPYEGLSKVYAHEVVVRSMDGGNVQYVSNRIIPDEDNYEETWHTPRLTREEWEEIYGAGGNTVTGIEENSVTGIAGYSGKKAEQNPEEKECLITEEEKKQLQDLALQAAGQVRKVYEDVDTANIRNYGGIDNFTDEQCKEAVRLLGKAGFTSVAKDCNMENPENIEAFYSSYLEKQDAMFTIFEVNYNGEIGAFTFIYRENRLQTYYVGIGWQEGGIPEINSTIVSDVAEIKLTEKGYFIYAYEEQIPHSSLCQYWRTKPLSDKCRELTEKYIEGLSYVNYNMLVTNWDGSNVEDILMPCMFEDIYRIDTGEIFRTADRKIPAELYENIMTVYFPVSKEILREQCGYDEKTQSYSYEMIFASPYPPFGEVVDYRENRDGTITLIVDGVWPDYNSDCAFRNEIVVQPFGDGTFRYLSNIIEKGEMDIPVIEKGEGISVNMTERKEAEMDCKRMMELISGLYVQADKGESSNAVLSDEEVLAMQDRIKGTGEPVRTEVLYSHMDNFENVDSFLKKCLRGKSGSVVIYDVCSDGGIGRNKYIYDGENMYILSTRALWNENNKPEIGYVSYDRIEEWKYTDKGWFGYEVCVPKPPEVTEIVDGSCLVRVKPMSEEARELSEKCLKGLGYQGNNLLCSNWDESHMEELDYNGMYEYLYEKKYHEKFYSEDALGGIPREEFESLIMEYLPVTAEQIRKYAVFDEENQIYAWVRLGCFNYVPNFFGTSVPEVTDIRENEDGTVTLTVDAVCDMVLCDDAVITHELTVRFGKDGSFRYLGNRILNNGIRDIPEYQYRIDRE